MCFDLLVSVRVSLTPHHFSLSTFFAILLIGGVWKLSDDAALLLSCCLCLTSRHAVSSLCLCAPALRSVTPPFQHSLLGACWCLRTKRKEAAHDEGPRGGWWVRNAGVPRSLSCASLVDSLSSVSRVAFSFLFPLQRAVRTHEFVKRCITDVSPVTEERPGGMGRGRERLARRGSG